MGKRWRLINDDRSIHEDDFQPHSLNKSHTYTLGSFPWFGRYHHTFPENPMIWIIIFSNLA